MSNNQCSDLRICLLLFAQFLEERNDSKAAILIFGWAAFSHHQFAVFLCKAFTKIGQNVLEFRGHHGAILFFVIELEDLNEVVVATTVLVLLDGDEHGDELLQFHCSLAFLGRDTELFELLVGGVQVNGTEQIRDVPGINSTLAIEVEDVEGEFHPFLVLCTDFGHLGG